MKITIPAYTVNFSALKGHVFTSVTHNDCTDTITFSNDDVEFVLKHEQSCCEDVYIESITGDLDVLVDSEILIADETANCGDTDDHESCTWTFYKIATLKGWVDIRFFGSSNGYYSETAELKKIRKVSADELKVTETEHAWVWVTQTTDDSTQYIIHKPHNFDDLSGQYVKVVDDKVVFSYTKD
jgi:hypothetical protein